MIAEGSTRVKDYLNKTKLKTFDYVINPYVGCPNKCLYCYAAYMCNFSKHDKAWGDFIEVKRTNKKINTFKIKDKKVAISTVTDPYNKFEEKYAVTRMIMEQLVKSQEYISVVTKSKLVLRDVDLFKQMQNVEVALSICTLDENIKSKLEPYSSSIAERLEVLKELKQNGIKTVVFLAPIIPLITDVKHIIESTREFTDEYWFDKLALRNVFKTNMFQFIENNFPLYKSVYEDIYIRKQSGYFEELIRETEQYCLANNIKYKTLFEV